MEEGREAPASRSEIQGAHQGLIPSLVRVRDALAVFGNPAQSDVPDRTARSSKRTRKIVLVTIEQYQKLLPLLPQHCRVMVILAMCLGLRVSEILGLRWQDVDLEEAILQVRRSVVNGHVEDTKTLTSADELPLHPDLVEVLRQWREAELTVNGWLFGNIDTGKPYHADTMRQRHLNKAAAKIGLQKLGWHAFQHTYRARLSELALPLEVQQKLMRHASIDMTTKYGRNSMLNVTRPANARIVEMVMQKSAEKAKREQV